MTRTTRTIKIRGTLSIALGIATLGAARAGSLDPSAPPGPTMKTLVDVEPRTAIPGGTGAITIATPGSYYLAGNRTGVAGANGITIDASLGPISLDLNGFSVVGVPGSHDGIAASAGSDVVIENGSVRGFGGDGVDADFGIGVLIENVIASGNGQRGISGVRACRIVGCIARENGGSGFVVNAGSVVQGCTADSNGGIPGSSGFSLWQATARECTALSNSGHGFDAANGSSVIGCTSIGNSDSGIVAQSGALVLDNECQNNTTGISVAGQFAVVRGNIVSYGSTGISCANGSLVIGNIATANTTNYDLTGATRAGAIDVLTTQGEIQTNAIANFSF